MSLTFIASRPSGQSAQILAEREVALRELGAAAVDAVEDVDHDVDGLVGAGDLFDVEVDVADAEERLRRPMNSPTAGGQLGVLAELGGQLPRPALPMPEQVGDIDPERIVLHLHRLVEGEHLAPQGGSEAR